MIAYTPATAAFWLALAIITPIVAWAQRRRAERRRQQALAAWWRERLNH